MTFLTLNIEAVAVAIGMGVLFFVFGLGLGGFFVLVMLYFLFLSATSTHIGHVYKKRAGLFEYQRGVKNVLANGLWPLLMVIMYFILNYFVSIPSNIAIIGFMAGVAAVTADKFSSELGVLDGIPRSIIGFRKVNKGVSGGITLFGLGTGLLGGFLVGTLSIFLYMYFAAPVMVVLFVTVGGFAGTIFDSIFGWFEERGIGNKFTSNFFASVMGSVIGIILFLLL